MNQYNYSENLQAADWQSGMNETQTKKAPNIFKQLIYSVIPSKYSELANVKVKGFIFYFLSWCLAMCTVIWISMVVSTGMEVIGERLANGYVLAYDRLPVIILILVGISIPICIIVTIMVAVVSAIIYCIEGLPVALIIKAISKKQCSLFDLYKSAVYCQTPVNLSVLCMMVLLGFVEDMTGMSLLIGIARIVSLVILIFGIRNLPAKPLIPQNKQSATEGNQYRAEGRQCRSESNQYKVESIHQTCSTPSKPRVAPGCWVCTCGRQNPSYTGTCTCGKSKY